MDRKSLSREQHAIFRAYPLDAQVVVGGERLSSPYHIYDGSAWLIAGRANAEAVAQLLARESLRPLLDSEGNALAAVWVTDFTQTNLGPHHELQISLFATFKDQRSADQPVKAHRFAVLKALARPEDNVKMVCHGLWNNTKRVVTYNREHLKLDAQLTQSSLQRTGLGSQQRLSFRFLDAQGDELLSGQLQANCRQPAGAMFRLLGHLGAKAIWRGLRTRFVSLPVVNTISPWSTENLVALTFTQGDRQAVRDYEPAADQLVLSHPGYTALEFKPDFIQQVEGVRFVYLRPERR